MEELSLVQRLIVSIVPAIFAITVHEYSHGWVAAKLGDPTAKMLGRLTLNPIKHIDPIGTLLVPGLMIMMGGAFFGWAKPVPISYDNLRHAKRDVALVALAGPGSNVLMALAWAILFKFSFVISDFQMLAFPLMHMAYWGIMINIMLCVLNLLPILPLDGGRVLSSLLTGKAAYAYDRTEPYGLFIVLGLFATGLLWAIMRPLAGGLQAIVFALAGIG